MNVMNQTQFHTRALCCECNDMRCHRNYGDFYNSDMSSSILKGWPLAEFWLRSCEELDFCTFSDEDLSSNNKISKMKKEQRDKEAFSMSKKHKRGAMIRPSTQHMNRRQGEGERSVMPAELGDNTCWKFINGHLIGLDWATDWENVHGKRGHHSDFIYKFIRSTGRFDLLVDLNLDFLGGVLKGVQSYFNPIDQMTRSINFIWILEIS